MKQSGSYLSLLRGISQQAPEVRQPGQHSEQVNMVPDPVNGLTRRRGSILKTTKKYPLSFTDTADNTLAWGGTYRVHEHKGAGVGASADYVLLVRNVTPASLGTPSQAPILCYDRTNHQWIDVDVSGTANVALADIITYGIGALVSVGEYINYVRNNDTPLGYTINPQWGVADFRSSCVAWVRGGAYDRTYRLDFGGLGSVAYTTPAAGVAGAATAIAPENIAEQLKNGVVTLFGAGAVRNGSHIYIPNIHVDIAVSDGGDGTLLRSICKTVDSADDLTIMALDGQIVKVQAGVDSAYYVKAVNKGASFGETIWQETAGESQFWNNFPTMWVGPGTDGLKLYLSNSSAGLSARIGRTVPTSVPSASGDTVNNPRPTFLTKPITYLGIFQNRLLVGASGTLAVSAAGDYYNFFRSTVTTIPASDPFEMVPQGNEDDVLRYSVVYNRNLVIFGDKRQYLISGTQQLTPLTPNMSVMTTYANAATTAPLAAGGLIYYARDREGNVEIHQIQPGSYVDSAESFPASAQIGDYIPAPVQQLEVIPGSPSTLLVRSRSSNSVYTFSYLDQQDGRKQDAWSRWEFNDVLGSLAGVYSTPEGTLLFYLRKKGDEVWRACDIVPRSVGISDVPYFDSARKYDAVLASGAIMDVATTSAGWVGAYGKTSIRWLIGGDLVDDVPDLITQYPTETSSLWVGAQNDAYFDPTNPFPKDGNGKLVLKARLTVTNVGFSVEDSAGFTANITTPNGTTSYSYNGRILGNIANLIGRVPVTDGVYSVSIGRAFNQYQLSIHARNWAPLTVVSMDWTGQLFNRTPRVSQQ